MYTATLIKHSSLILLLTALERVGDLLDLQDVVVVVRDAGLLVVGTHGGRLEASLGGREQRQKENWKHNHHHLPSL